MKRKAMITLGKEIWKRSKGHGRNKRSKKQNILAIHNGISENDTKKTNSLTCKSVTLPYVNSNNDKRMKQWRTAVITGVGNKMLIHYTVKDIPLD
jgi:hypothetical protein